MAVGEYTCNSQAMSEGSEFTLLVAKRGRLSIRVAKVDDRVCS